MWITPNNERINDDDQYTGVDGIQYPSNYNKATISELKRLTMTNPPIYDPITQSVNDIGQSLIDGNYVQQWEVVSLGKSEVNRNLLARITTLQQKALRALVEDAPDTTYLNQYKTEIAALRSQWQK